MKPANDALKRLDRIAPMIGNTPLLSIRYSYRGGPAKTIYAKAEYYNYTGSIKDRMAFHILREAYRSGRLRGGETLAGPPAATPASRSPLSDGCWDIRSRSACPTG